MCVHEAHQTHDTHPPTCRDRLQPIVPQHGKSSCWGAAERLRLLSPHHISQSRCGNSSPKTQQCVTPRALAWLEASGPSRLRDRLPEARRLEAGAGGLVARAPQAAVHGVKRGAGAGRGGARSPGAPPLLGVARRWRRRQWRRWRCGAGAGRARDGRALRRHRARGTRPCAPGRPVTCARRGHVGAVLSRRAPPPRRRRPLRTGCSPGWRRRRDKRAAPAPSPAPAAGRGAS